MELHQLRYLVAVAEEGSFTRAAAREHVAQPAVSAAVAALERELGVRLLERGPRGAHPTAAGRDLLVHARSCLAAVAQVRETAAEITGVLRGRVALGMVVGCTAAVLAELLADFAAQHPGVAVELVEGSSAELLAGLAAGELDVAWVGRAEPAPAGTTTLVLLAEDQVAVLAPGHDLLEPGRTTLPVACLDGRRVVVLPRGTGGRAALDAACASAGAVPEVAFEVSGLEMVQLLAAQGLGVGVVPASVAAGRGDGLRVLPLDPPVRSRIELAWRDTGPASPAGRALLAVARTHVAAAQRDRGVSRPRAPRRPRPG